MYAALPDGSAISASIPIRPFLGVQHNQVDVASASRMANYAYRSCLENGWCKFGRPAQQIVDEANFAETQDQTTFFVGVDVALLYDVDAQCRRVPSASSAMDHLRDTVVSELNPSDHSSATAMYEGRYWMASLGNSIYNVYGELRDSQPLPMGQLGTTPPPPRELSGLGKPFATFNVAIIHVRKKERKATVIPPIKRSYILEALSKLQPSAASAATVLAAPSGTPSPSSAARAAPTQTIKNGRPTVERIDPQQMEKALSSLCTDGTDVNVVFPTTSGDQTTALALGYQRSFHLRESDVDFNHHVNHLAFIRFVIDTFRAALGDPATVFPRLLDPGVSPLIGDLLIRRLRIDYVREVPKDHACVDVLLFFEDEASRDAVVGSRVGGRRGTLAEVWFVTRGMLTDGSDAKPFVSTVGKLFVYV